ncbi:Alpha/Beta hydrolase protein, partial [Rhodocollybia butyracea]
NDLDVHYLQASSSANAPLIILLHGFPELAYSWREVMPKLSEAGYNVCSSRSTGVWSYRFVSCCIRLPKCCISYRTRLWLWVAGYCALIRPDLFRSVVIMSAPFQGVPLFTAFIAFLADNFYAKSADWPINNPHRLPSASASNLATLPHYYIMLLEQTMPMAVRNAVNEGTRSLEAWLPQEELAFYVSEYSRTGFQGGLNGLGCIPIPGALEDMKERVCKHMDDDDLVLVPDAGHWVQQEQSEAVVEHLKRFLAKVSPKE